MLKKVLIYSLTLLWCLIIFIHSGMPESLSSKESMFFLMYINGGIGYLFGETGLILSEMLVRKAAHFIEYFILGLLTFKSLHLAGVKNGKLNAVFLISVLLGISYAVSDEIHQFYVPGRAMRLFDVFIDSMGLLCGNMAVYLFIKRKQSLGSHVH